MKFNLHARVLVKLSTGQWEAGVIDSVFEGESPNGSLYLPLFYHESDAKAYKVKYGIASQWVPPEEIIYGVVLDKGTREYYVHPADLLPASDNKISENQIKAMNGLLNDKD